MEENSRLEKLVEFKTAYGASIRAVRGCLQRFCPETTEEEREGFVCSFFPFLFGIWPYAAVTEKQRRAMELAGVEYEKSPSMRWPVRAWSDYWGCILLVNKKIALTS